MARKKTKEESSKKDQTERTEEAAEKAAAAQDEKKSASEDGRVPDAPRRGRPPGSGRKAKKGPAKVRVPKLLFDALYPAPYVAAATVTGLVTGDEKKGVPPVDFDRGMEPTLNQMTKDVYDQATSAIDIELDPGIALLICYGATIGVALLNSFTIRSLEVKGHTIPEGMTLTDFAEHITKEKQRAAKENAAKLRAPKPPEVTSEPPSPSAGAPSPSIAGSGSAATA